jgi:DNA helicase HerA-like ATPase
MLKEGRILVGKSGEKELCILPQMANRHGLITGATGSGKTITLKVMAESFSEMGVPVFLSDIKGDLAGTCLPGEASEKLNSRLQGLGINDFKYKGFPVIFWDVFGKDGHPVRAKIEDIDPVILSRMLGLSEVQEGVLALAMRIARDKNMPVIDLKDLRTLLNYVGENRKEYTISYGNMSTQSIGSIQRSIIQLEDQGGDRFFGEPSLDINDFLKVDSSGNGHINILHAVELFKQPDLYATFMLWLLSTLNNTLPEVGDLDKPKVVFFFDEAHLLFKDLRSDVLTKITQIVKLIRSKGIGLYFISQSPNDIPNEILAQLGNKVQHTLRAYTPAEQKVVKAVSQSFRANPEFDTEKAILELGTGEAVISFLNEKGEPNIVEKCTVLPPQSQMGALDDSTRLMVISRSVYQGKYDTIVDRESAFEILSKEMEEAKAAKEAEIQAKEEEKRLAEEKKAEERAAKEAEKLKKQEEREKKELEKEAEKARKNSIQYKVGKAAERTANSALNSVGRKIGNQIIKSLFGK